MSTAGPSDWVRQVESAPENTTVFLDPSGDYRVERLHGIRKPAGRKVTIDGQGARFSGGTTLAKFGSTAEEAAREAHRAGRYPGVYLLSHRATLSLNRCSGLRLRNFIFEDSWPTAIHIRQCSDLEFENIEVRGSSYAFYAVGEETMRLKLTGCKWTQDMSEEKVLWNSVLWEEVHQEFPEPDDKRYNHNRAYDGSFFVGVDITGDIEIAHCQVKHAFNGVQLFNPDFNPKLSRNVRVHHCTFSHIRDNVIEPENCAYNWWFHDNEIHNCHKWLSLETPSAGWFYFFQNIGWFDDVGGPDGDSHRNGAVIKAADDERRLARSAGPIYIFNNSWYLRHPIAKGGAVAQLQHHNNAIVFCSHGSWPKPEACKDKGVFGDHNGKPADYFTKNWDKLGIRFFNDAIAYPGWPTVFVNAGYDIDAGVGGEPEFEAPHKGKFGLVQRPTRVALGKGKSVDVELPGTLRRSWKAREPFNIGCWQDAGFAAPEYEPMRDELPGILPLG